MTEIDARRGNVYRMLIEPDTAMLCLVVSANTYNRAHDAYITVLVTASRQILSLPSWVRLTSGDPVFGHVVCSDIGMVGKDELKEDLGPLTFATMEQVEAALKNALSL